MICKIHRFRTVSKANNIFSCRKCLKLFSNFVPVDLTDFKEIEVIKIIPLIKKRGFWERFLLYIKNIIKTFKSGFNIFNKLN